MIDKRINGETKTTLCQCENVEHIEPCKYPGRFIITTSYGKFVICEYCLEMEHMPYSAVRNF